MSSMQVWIWRMVMWWYILACEPITENIGFRQLLIDKLWSCTIGQWAGLTNWLIWGGDGGSSSEEGQGSPSTFGILSKLLMYSWAFCKSAQSPFCISFEHFTWGLCLWPLVNNFLKLSCNSTVCAIPDILGVLHKLSSSLLPELILSLILSPVFQYSESRSQWVVIGASHCCSWWRSWFDTLWTTLIRLWLNSSSCYLQIVVVEISLQFHS
jgi:hypothetical protein